MHDNDQQQTVEEIEALERRLHTLKQAKKRRSGGSYILPLTIIVAGGLLASAIYSAPTRNAPSQINSLTASTPIKELPPRTFGGIAQNIRPVDEEDHIRGDLDAEVFIVEYSDFECPFCKRFHPILKRVMDTYQGGNVAWVYRHFPLDDIHSKARIEAAASELAVDLGGNEAFWEYADKIFERTPSNDGLDLNALVDIAVEMGFDPKPFEDLIAGDPAGGPYAEHIEADYRSAIAAGGAGTPYTVIVAKNGKTFPLTGAQNYTAIVTLVELALKEE